MFVIDPNPDWRIFVLGVLQANKPVCVVWLYGACKNIFLLHYEEIIWFRHVKEFGGPTMALTINFCWFVLLSYKNNKVVTSKLGFQNFMCDELRRPILA